jgi:inner membrane protein
MDLLSQAVLGACAAQAAAGHRLPRSAWLIGSVAGLLPDADILIRPEGDPLGGLLWHRHFSHALVMAPVLGLAVAAIAWAVAPSLRTVKGWTVAAAGAAVLTHGPLDAATSYGTLLHWPFTERRVAWDLLPILDPAVTLPMMLLLAISVWRSWRACRRGATGSMTTARAIAAAGVLWTIAYAGLGAAQRAEVLRIQARLAESRGHVIEAGRTRAMPQPLSQLLWRSVYEHGDPLTGRRMIQADFIRVPHWPYSLESLGGPEPQVLEGTPVRLLERDDLLARRDLAVDVDPRIGETFDRFAWFADGFVALSAERPLVVGDMRYAIGPESTPLWGLMLPTRGLPESELRMGQRFGDSSKRANELWEAITGRDPRMVPAE